MVGRELNFPASSTEPLKSTSNYVGESVQPSIAEAPEGNTMDSLFTQLVQGREWSRLSCQEARPHQTPRAVACRVYVATRSEKKAGSAPGCVAVHGSEKLWQLRKAPAAGRCWSLSLLPPPSRAFPRGK